MTRIKCVIPLGLEPKTHSLEGCCSIQLSYGTILIFEIGCKGNSFFADSQIFYVFLIYYHLITLQPYNLTTSFIFLYECFRLFVA